MENYKAATNCPPDKEEKVSLEWSYSKETQWIHRKVVTRLKRPGGSKTQSSQKRLQENGRGRSHESGEDMERD
jgi:hypothetical protein